LVSLSVCSLLLACGDRKLGDPGDASTSVGTGAGGTGAGGTGAGGTGTGAGGSGGGVVEPEWMSWCDPAAWPSGLVPADGANVTIGQGASIRLDCDTALLGELHVHGSLRVDAASDVSLTASSIHVMDGGRFRIGEPDAPYAHRVRVTLTGERGLHMLRANDNALDNDGQSRALHVQGGGEVSWFGAVPSRLRTRLAADAADGATTLVVTDSVSEWKSGDRIAISTTDFYGVSETEVHRIAAVGASGTTLTLETPLSKGRWGRLQYPLDVPVDGSGVSLAQGPFHPPGKDTPLVIDERAHVVLLERPITVESADDAHWRDSGFGAHIMVMGLSSVFRVSGAIVERGGQRQAMGRYPFHWHMLSYSLSDGAFLGDVDPQKHFIENSVVLGSVNRAYTIHGTSGARLENNVAVDVLGHAYFLEDGTEMNNTLRSNVAMKVRPCRVAGVSCALKVHDEQPTGFWITNPTNRVVENVASDASSGMWNSFSAYIFGESALAGAKNPLDPTAEFSPITMPLLEHRDNEVHGNADAGIRTDQGVFDEAGNTSNYYGNAARRYKPEVPPKFTGNRSWKNIIGYRNQVFDPRYRGWMVADNQIGFMGATLLGSLVDTLVVGRTHNDASALPNTPDDGNRRAVASYHHTIDFIDVTAVNFAGSAPEIVNNGQFVRAGGFFNGEDLYLFPVNLNLIRNTGWQLVNTVAGFLTVPPHFDQFPTTLNGFNRNYSISVTYDPYGYWGPKGNWLVPDAPYYTHGLAPSEIVLAPGSGRVSTSRLVVGISDLSRDMLDEPFLTSAVRFERLTTTGFQVPSPNGVLAPVLHPSSGRNIAMHDIPSPSSWIPGGRFSTVFAGHHLKLSFPGGASPSGRFRMNLNNASSLPAPSPSPNPNDFIVVAVPWSGSSPPVANVGFEYLWSTFGQTGTLPNPLPAQSYRAIDMQASSLADFISAASNPDGRKLYFDDANDLVWLKIAGGLEPPPNSYFQQCRNTKDLSVECLFEGYVVWVTAP